MPSSIPLHEPWQSYYTQIEEAARSFWQQANYLEHGRIQTLEIWLQLQKKVLDLLSNLFANAPLKPFEHFLLSAATLLYESGWQAPGGSEATVARRYELSGQLIRQSYLRQEGAPSLGLSTLDPLTVKMLVNICAAMGQQDLSHVSSVPVPGGHQETARPRYLVALLQLADALLVPRQKALYFSQFYASTPFREKDEARLALHPYVIFTPAPGNLTTFTRINPVDERYEQKILACLDEPIQRWWAANWRWLAGEFQVEITLYQTEPEKDRDFPPVSLSTACKALPPYLESYQPPALDLPTINQVREVCRQAAKRSAAATNSAGQSALPTTSAAQEETPAMPEPAELYDDFHLHIDRHGHIIASSNEGEAQGDCEVRIPSNVALTLTLVAHNTRDAILYKELGRHLYDYIFPRDINTLFQKSEAVARSRSHKTRIRLDIEAETLARLPLEFLYREDRGHFLAIDPQTALSRYLHVTYPRNRVRRKAGTLHMLLIISSPNDQTPLDIAEWKDAIYQALAEPIDQRLLTLDCVTGGTYEEINRALLKHKPHIIQFVGHGIYQHGTSSLALMHEDGSTWLIDGTHFANMFLGSLDHLGLFCLASCESAMSDNPQGFLGVTPQLLQRGVPAVVAMQYSVSIATARLFFSQLYQSVASHKPIDWAVQQARNAVSIKHGSDNREFATPVLYMRAEDGDIFD